MMADADDTMIPMKDVRAKPIGMVKNCDHKASRGFWAKRAKSGSLTIKVAKLAMELMTPLTNAHASSLPDMVAGCRTIGPTPPARTTAQMRKAIPATGTKYDLTVNKWRIWWTGNQMAGNEQSQKMKKEAKSAVDVPDSSGKGPRGILLRSYKQVSQQIQKWKRTTVRLTQFNQMARIMM